MDSRILSACLTRGNYDECKRILGDSFARSFSPAAKITAELLEDFYARDEAAASCGIDVLLDRAKKKEFAPKHLEALESFIRGLDGSVSVPNLLHDLRQHQRFRVGDKLAGLLANRAEGKEVDALIEEYTELGDEDATTNDDEGEVFSNVSVLALLEGQFGAGTGTIPFALDVLNERTGGGFRAGHHVLVFARPEVGKSLFVIDQTCFWIESGYRVLFIENEDPIADTTMRVMGRLCRRTREEIFAHPDLAQDVLDRRGYSNFVGVSLSPGNYKSIGKLVDDHRPDIVVLNQIRNIDVGDDNRVQALEKAAIGARNLGKKQGVRVVSVTQAGDSATGKAFLDMSDIDSSKTGIPGATDLIIGLGGTDEDIRFGFRHGSLPKNKLGGNHQPFTMRFNTALGTVEQVAR
jgi:hypothetical protein